MFFGFENITIQYKDKPILENVSMSFPKGSIVTIIGQNGSGKSSILKTIPRALKPKSGRVIYNDKDLSAYSPKFVARKIGYLAQIHTSPPDIDVKTLVSYGRYPHTKFLKSLNEDDKSVVDEAIEKTGLAPLKDRTISTLSGGERQRAWIAMIIAQQPEILVLDEPTTYLDISYQIEVLDLIDRLNKEMGITIVMVLHDLNLAARYSDYLYTLGKGGIEAEGKPSEVITQEGLRRLFDIETNVLEDKENKCPFFIPLKGCSRINKEKV